jgi:hypothetical protein
LPHLSALSITKGTTIFDNDGESEQPLKISQKLQITERLIGEENDRTGQDRTGQDRKGEDVIENVGRQPTRQGRGDVKAGPCVSWVTCSSLSLHCSFMLVS